MAAEPMDREEMKNRLADIVLAGDQMTSLQMAAQTADAELLTSYAGEFRPAGSPRCVALKCDSPGQLMRFAGHVTLARGIEPALLAQLVSRMVEDQLGTVRVYYWPGVIAPDAAAGEPESVPAMLKVAGKRFACERCGATVFTRTGEIFACNGCGTRYAEPGRA